MWSIKKILDIITSIIKVISADIHPNPNNIQNITISNLIKNKT